MGTLEQVAADLPNFPEDVISQWIGYYAETEGWPPPEPLDGRWKDLLANRNLDYWRSLSWKLESFYPPSLELIENSSSLIQQIIGFHAKGESNNYSAYMGEEAKTRFHNLLYYLRVHGNLPCPAILIDHNNKYEVMDGNHRIAAYLLWEYWKDEAPFQKEPFPVAVSKEIQFWVGYKND